MGMLQHALEATGHWFVLHVRSRQEKALAADLRALGVAHYLPTAEEVRYYGKRKQRVSAPLFPGYVFLRGALDDAYRADRTKRVARVLPVPRPDLLELELSGIDRALAETGGLKPHPFLERGVAVEVRAGPLRGVRGVVESWRSRDRLVLQVQTLGQASSLEIDGSLLDAVDNAWTSAGRAVA